MSKTLFTLLFAAAWAVTARAEVNLAPHLESRHGVQQLIVDGQPFLVLGGELGNSSASSAVLGTASQLAGSSIGTTTTASIGSGTATVPLASDVTTGSFDVTLTAA